MRRIRGKSLAVTVLALALSTVATPCPAAASSSTPHTHGRQNPHTGHTTKSDRLRGALLTAKDLAPGYTSVLDPGPAFARIGADSNLCDDLTSVSTGKGPGAQAVFVKDVPGPALVERIAAGGAPRALAAVWSVATAPTRCPAIHTGTPGKADEVYLTFATMRTPKLGDASAGVRFRLRVRAMGADLRGVLITAARRGVAMTLVVIGGTAADRRALPRVAARAFAKLDAAKLDAAKAGATS